MEICDSIQDIDLSEGEAIVYNQYAIHFQIILALEVEQGIEISHDFAWFGRAVE